MNKLDFVVLSNNKLKEKATREKDTLTFDEFMKLRKKGIIIDVTNNVELMNNSELLSHVFYSTDLRHLLPYFNVKAFENIKDYSFTFIDSIKDIDEIITKYEVKDFLFSNPSAFFAIFKSDPLKYASFVNENVISDELIDYISKCGIAIPFDIVYGIDKLKNDNTILYNALKDDFSVIFTLDDINSDLMKKIESNYIISVDDIIEYRSIINNDGRFDKLLKNSLVNNPDIITYIDDFNKVQYEIDVLIHDGYVLSEEQVYENHNLLYTKLFEYSITKNPYLVYYVDKNTYINHEAFKKIEDTIDFTEDIIFDHPNILQHDGLLYNFPELKVYSSKYPIQEKKKMIKEKLIKGENLLQIPFMRWEVGYDGRQEYFDSLIEILDYKSRFQKEYLDGQRITDNRFEETINNTTSSYFNRIISKLATVKYNEDKFTFQFRSYNELHDRLIKGFNENESIEDIVSDLYLFTLKSYDVGKITENVIRLYEEYKETNNISFGSSTRFYKNVLDHHKNAYINAEKQRLEQEFKDQGKLSDKKKQVVVNGSKMRIINSKINELINPNEKSEKQVKIRKSIYELVDRLNNNKDLRKLNININKDYFYILVSRGFIITDADIRNYLE